jgi:chitosanase
MLTQAQTQLIEHVINAFETGRPEGDYGALVVMADGPDDCRQITYGRSQCTEYSTLRVLVKMYSDADGVFSEQLKPYVDLVGVKPLCDDQQFRRLLEAAAEDQAMRACQDRLFQERYLRPALLWCGQNGFTLPLSALVVYDSWIHSGGVPSFLRRRFQERPPAAGGSEQAWIAAYVRTRHEWLRSHTRPVLRNTVYRTECLLKQIRTENWDLGRLPIVANGCVIKG